MLFLAPRVILDPRLCVGCNPPDTWLSHLASAFEAACRCSQGCIFVFVCGSLGVEFGLDARRHVLLFRHSPFQNGAAAKTGGRGHVNTPHAARIVHWLWCSLRMLFRHVACSCRLQLALLPCCKTNSKTRKWIDMSVLWTNHFENKIQMDDSGP